MENLKAKKNWKQRFLHEFSEYWINVVYMALFPVLWFYIEDC